MQVWSRCALMAMAIMGSALAKDVDENKYDVLPPAVPPKFPGKIGLRTNESVAAFPDPMAPPEGAPNILLILIDDAGKDRQHYGTA